MKTKFLFLSLLLCSTFSFSQTVIRVQNGQNIETLVNSTTFVSGTILLLDPGSYGNVEFKKRVSLIGSGYFNGVAATTFGIIRFSNDNLGDSQGSFMTGCATSGINIDRPNITVQRCGIYKTGFSTSIDVANVNNIKLQQCFVDGNININGSASNFLVQNCIVIGRIGTNASGVNYSGRVNYNSFINEDCRPINFSEVNSNIVISNNIFTSPSTCNNANGQQNFRTNYFAKFNNNVVRQGNYQSSDPSTKFLTDTDMARVLFTTAGTSAEGRYILSATSPAKGAGEGGTDCGAFGGSEPYLIGGLPVGPVITDLQVPSTARQNETIQIKLKAKVQN